MKIDESFVYLGRYFDFNMANKDHKNILLSKTNELLNTIDNIPAVPTVADLPITWVKQNLDNIASKFTPSWLEIPTAGTLNIIR